MAELDAENLPLEKVFSSDFEFYIPRYQRPYAWGSDQTLQLLEDLEEALDRGDDEAYFLGSVVLVKKKGVAQAEVIDGQQRLTTLTILMAVLRDLAVDKKVRDGIQQHLADTSKAWKTNAKTKPRLTIRTQDREFFRDHVQDPASTGSIGTLSDTVADTDPRKAIRNNAHLLRERLSSWPDQRRTELFELMLERTFLVVVSTPDQESAYRIFSVMNARGLDLSPTDIFKADVIGAISEDQQDAYADKWDAEESDLGRDGFTDLFRDIRTLRTRDRAKRELLKEFPEQVLNKYLASGQATNFVDDVLVPYSDAFELAEISYFVESAPEWAAVNEWLRRLRQLDNKDWRPPALWALRHHGHDPSYLAEFFRLLERVAVCSMLRGEYATPRAERYLDLLKELDGQAGLGASKFLVPDDEKAEARAALEGEIYRTLRSVRRKYVLTRLDSLLAKESGVTYNHKIISVEHVLPQNPAEGSEWMTLFSEDERRFWTHRLGNLLLLNKRTNSAANRKPFKQKKKSYFQSKGGGTNFQLTAQVLSESAWTPAVVKARHEELLGRLFTEWDLT
ncbi:DUF262 domain-containing protein [Nocardioides sp. zg-536]|uniref:DUF262 domain-containing protein n=1 Tax=Nocardioides faecalis TaxID=2803858 RepID=A0A938Y7X0_9ACTN|nr:DUF262 domain-containing protein [Nocardioides faecalis]MBM9460837.1 DUF262 domain-containing protein [Nocardioides faecalis]QVI58025.1 DUF262 domain-containing protein [Nocardioides faecalis]